MKVRYLGGLPGLGEPRDTHVERTSAGIKVKEREGIFRGKWIDILRDDIIGVSYIPEGGREKLGTGATMVTGGLLAAGEPLLGLASYAVGRGKSGLIVLKIRHEGGFTVDVLFEAKKREKTYNEFVQLLVA